MAIFNYINTTHFEDVKFTEHSAVVDSSWFLFIDVVSWTSFGWVDRPKSLNKGMTVFHWNGNIKTTRDSYRHNHWAWKFRFRYFLLRNNYIEISNSIFGHNLQIIIPLITLRMATGSAFNTRLIPRSTERSLSKILIKRSKQQHKVERWGTHSHSWYRTFHIHHICVK